MIASFVNAFLGAFIDPFLLSIAAGAGWFIPDRFIRAVATFAAAVILSEAILWLLGEVSALWTPAEWPYIAAGTTARWFVAWPVAEIVAWVKPRLP